jgi:hypothetical protein
MQRDILDPTHAEDRFTAEQAKVIEEFLVSHRHEAGEACRQLSAFSPALAFAVSPLWAEAVWSSTTFRWHPQSAAPPVMGIVFDNTERGRELFRTLAEQIGNDDTTDQMRVSIIEGDVPGQRPGYTVHIGPDPESLRALGTFEDIIVSPKMLLLLGQLNRMYPIPGQPNLLDRFKREFAKHKEFLLAPVTRRSDGQLWADVELGVIKKSVHFRDLADINEGDIDAATLALPLLITPRPD